MSTLLEKLHRQVETGPSSNDGFFLSRRDVPENRLKDIVNCFWFDGSIEPLTNLYVLVAGDGGIIKQVNYSFSTMNRNLR